MLASYRVHEMRVTRCANAGPVSLAHKGLPLPHCMQDILPSNLRKNFSYLAFGHAALPPRIPKQFLRISYLLTSYLFSMWLVCQYPYTRAACLRLDKFEFLLLALSLKKTH